MNKLFCILLFLLAGALYGDEWEIRNKKANELMQAGFNLDAERGYHSLLQQPLQPWQSDVVHYNLGTLYLRSGEEEQALGQFVQVHIETAPPYLIQPFYRNSSLALLNNAKLLADKKEYFLSALYMLIAKKILKSQQFPWSDKQEETFQHTMQNLLASVEKNIPSELKPLTLLLIKTIFNPAITESGLQELGKMASALKNNPLIVYIQEAKKEQLSGFAASARLFLIEAAYSVFQLGTTTSKEMQDLPLRVLRAALQKQKEAKELAKLIELFRMKESISKDVETELLTLQLQVVKEASLFPQEVLRWQKDAYAGIDKGAKCLDEPWKRAVPLFDKGFTSANQAKGFLVGPVSLSHAIKSQTETIDYWTSALHTMQEEKQPEPEKKEQNKLIQQIKEMNFQDQIFEPAPARVRHVEKPW